jgi:hypothetical protein
MSVTQVSELTASLAPAVHKALETDLGSYCRLCNQLNMQKLEFPCAFAGALLEEVVQQRQQRERLAAAAAAGAGGDLVQDWVQDAVGSVAAPAAAAVEPDCPDPAAGGDAGGAGDSSRGQRVGSAAPQQEQQQGDSAAAAAAGADRPDSEAQPGPSKPPSSLQKQGLRVSVRVCELETTFAGPVRLQNPTHLKPLSSIRLGGGRSAAAAAAAAAAADPDACVRLGRPLSEVIAAANAQLAGRYRKQVASGLWELCERLKGAAAAPPAAAAAGGSNAQQEQQQQEVPQPTARPSSAGAGNNSSSSSGGSDVFGLLSLLRRMMLWPVTADLLRTTAAGKQVAALKQHPDPHVSALADQVVQQWRASLARQAVAAAAAKARKDTEKGGKAGDGKGGKPGAEEGGKGGLVVETGLRHKVVGMLWEALCFHRKAVMSAAAAAAELELEGGRQLGKQPANKGTEQQQQDANQQQQQQQQQLAAERPKLQQLAESLEAALQQHIQQQQQAQPPGSTAAGSTAGTSPTAAAAAGGGRGGQSPAVLLQAYKARVRMLCTGLRYPDGVSAELLSGSRPPQEVSDVYCCTAVRHSCTTVCTIALYS